MTIGIDKMDGCGLRNKYPFVIIRPLPNFSPPKSKWLNSPMFSAVWQFARLEQNPTYNINTLLMLVMKL